MFLELAMIFNLDGKDAGKMKPEKTGEKNDKVRSEPESVGTPIDSTPSPDFPPMHQGEKLDAASLLINVLGKPTEDEDDVLPHEESSER